MFPIVKDAKNPLIKNWQNEVYLREKLTEHDGGFGLATGKISGDVVVIDLDLRYGFGRDQNEAFREIRLHIEKALPHITATLISKTPHGIHLFYNVAGNEYRNTANKNGGYTKKGFNGKNVTKFGGYLSGIDTRANGGYVIIPPTNIKKDKYKWITNIHPKKINLKEFESLISFLLIGENKKLKVQHSMRQGFIDIFNGKINPNDYKKVTGKAEHVYWKEAFHEAHTCCGLKPEDLLVGLEQFQAGFDLDKTKEQLNDQKNIDYILNMKRMSKAKYNEYFPGTQQKTITPPPAQQPATTPKIEDDIFSERELDNDEMYLEGYGIIHNEQDGLFLEKQYKNSSELFRILEGKLHIEKQSYETLNNNRIVFTGFHNKKHFRTYPFPDLLAYLQNYTYQGNRGRDIVKYYIHQQLENVPTYELKYVLGFNSHWNLPWLEEDNKFQILTATDKQIEAYRNSANMYHPYTVKEKKHIITLMQNFIKITQMDEVKLSIIIGWCMSAPFRHVFINKFALFPVLCAYGNRSTGKTSVIEYFCINFFDVYESYDASRLFFSSARFENALSMSSFPLFVQEVNIIPYETLSLIKEHSTGSSKYFRMKNSKENDFNCLKSAGLAIDCNTLPKTFQDPAMNTKLTVVPFTDEDIIELDPSWNNLKKELKKYKMFSLFYDYTKTWSDDDIEGFLKLYEQEFYDKVQKQKGDIEKDNPRIIQQYCIIAFGIDLFNEIFATEFDHSKVLDVMLGSRTVMTQSVLNDFYTYCLEAIIYDINNKNPNYLNHKLPEYKTRAKGIGYFFGSANKVDFQKFTQEKYSLDELVEKLRDALDDKEKETITKHNTGKVRGIFIHKTFFDIVRGVYIPPTQVKLP